MNHNSVGRIQWEFREQQMNYGDLWTVEVSQQMNYGDLWTVEVSEQI